MTSIISIKPCDRAYIYNVSVPGTGSTCNNFIGRIDQSTIYPWSGCIYILHPDLGKIGVFGNNLYKILHHWAIKISAPFVDYYFIFPMVQPEPLVKCCNPPADPGCISGQYCYLSAAASC